jgi:hypothetical protein
MTMRQQEPVEPSKADSAAQQLALRPLSAIHQDALICRQQFSISTMTLRPTQFCLGVFPIHLQLFPSHMFSRRCSV